MNKSTSYQDPGSPRKTTSPSMSSYERTQLLGNSQLVLQCLKNFGEVAPLAPLKPICGVALAIIETIQDFQKLKADHITLAQRVSDLVAGIDNEVGVISGTLSPELQMRVEILKRTLDDILAYLKSQRGLSWSKSLWKSQELKDKLSKYNDRLLHVRQLFNTTALLAIERHLAVKQPASAADSEQIFREMESRIDIIAGDFDAAQTAIRTSLNDVQAEVQRLAGVDYPNFCRHLRYDQISLECTTRTLPYGYICRGEIIGCHQGTKVTVKIFHSDEDSYREFHEDMQRLVNSGQENLIAVSVPGTAAPFLVLSD